MLALVAPSSDVLPGSVASPTTSPTTSSATPTWRVGANVVASTALLAVGIATGPQLLIGLGVAAVVGASCEALAPLHGGRRSARAYALDLTHAIGNRCLILPLVAVALTVAAPAMAIAMPASVNLGFAGLPGLAQIAILLVLTDFTNYIAHRGLHRVGLLWSFHAVHHSSERLDWLATSRGHPVDLAFNLFAISLPSLALDRIDLAPWLVTFFFLYPFVCHANARIRIPRLIGAILVTPEFHHWHHAAEARAHDRNFGAFLAVWDRLFGTAIEPGEFPDTYGIDGSDLDAGDYVGHLAAPFRRAKAA